MCGAFSIILTPRGWQEVFRVEQPKGWKTIYNARPGEVLPIITQQQPSVTTPALWNFVPHWMSGKAGSGSAGKVRGVINARAETLSIKPFYRTAIKSHRCIIPADGFYEWDKKNGVSIPYRIVHKNGQPFGFAGVYDELPDGSGNIGFAIVTTTANELVAKIHDRMPVMFDSASEERWLDKNTPTIQALSLLTPYPAAALKMFPVSRTVNSARHKDADVILPLR